MTPDARARPPRLPVPQAPPAGSRLRRRIGHLRKPGFVAAYIEAAVRRRAYERRLRRGALAAASVRDARADHVVTSFSSERDLPEQAASILSFLRHAGRPLEWTVVSDGSHGEASRALLEALDECVRVVDWREVASGAPAAALRAADRHPLGKKLAVTMSLPLGGPTLAVDSDVLFFAGARDLPETVAAATGPRYQLDCYNVLDDRIVAEAEQNDPTNTGVLLLTGRLDWSRGVAVLEDRLSEADFFRWDGPWVEQGVTHLALRDSGAAPLDPARFVISGDDMGRRREDALPASAVLRHYAGPTRHFFWMRVARESGAPRPSASP